MTRRRWVLVLGLTGCGDTDGLAETSTASETSAAGSDTAVTASEDESAGDGDGSTLTGDGDGTAGDGDGDGTGGDADGDGTAGDGDGTTGDGDGDGVSDDEALLRDAIAGLVDPAEALDTIADRGGLPVQTSTGSFLFACLCGPGSWSLAGDHEGWVGEAMDAAGADPLWWIERDIATPDGSLYKFTDGAAWIADPRGRRHGYDGFGRYSLVRASAAHLEGWYGVSGFGLQARDLEVYVPANGVFDRVVYAHDGQNLFDPDAFWGGWQLDAAVPAQMLVVGIHNTAARVDEYTHVVDGGSGGQADAYADLVELTIRPKMEAAYGAVPLVGVMGSSLGGLVSLHVADRHEDRYAMAISLSGTMGWGSLSPSQPLGLTMMDRYVAAGQRATALYIDSGGDGTCVDSDGDGIEDDGTDSDNFCTNRQLRSALLGLGYAEGTDLWYTHEPGAGHNESAWAGRVGAALGYFAGL